MTIPLLDHRGLLPPGRYVAALEQIPPRFCNNDYRWRLWDNVLDGLNELCDWAKRSPSTTPPLILGGSFFSDKPFPGDIEATLIYPQETPSGLCWDLFTDWARSRGAIKQQYRLDFCPTLPGNNDFSVFFQYVGPKTAAAKGLDEKDPRGVIEVLCW